MRCTPIFMWISEKHGFEWHQIRDSKECLHRLWKQDKNYYLFPILYYLLSEHTQWAFLMPQADQIFFTVAPVNRLHGISSLRGTNCSPSSTARISSAAQALPKAAVSCWTVVRLITFPTVMPS